MEKKGDQIVIKLSYSPKGDTMKLKLGDLPVRYIRLGVETDEEITILKTYMKKYNFDIPAIDQQRQQHEYDEQLPQPSLEKTRKRKAISNSNQTTHKKVQILEDRLLQPSTSYVEVYDVDADQYEGQKYSIQDL